MRRFSRQALLLVALTASVSELEGQVSVDRAAPGVASWAPQPLAPELALKTTSFVSADSTRKRPFYLPRPGEHAVFWVGFGTGLALSPLLWCEGSCGVVSKASTSLGLALVGAVSGLLLSRTF